MNNSFQQHLSGFLLDYLPHVRGYGSNAILAYRDTFVTLLRYLKVVKHVAIESVGYDDLDKKAIENFLLWLSGTKGLSNSTCNHRLAVIKSFFRYAGYASPELIVRVNDVLSMEKKKVALKPVDCLSLEAIGLLLEAAAKSGVRQLALLALLYDSGARVQEICDLAVGDFHSNRPFTIKATGKGSKTRIISIASQVAGIVLSYLAERRGDYSQGDPLFINRDGNSLGRAGVAYILKSCAEKAIMADRRIIPTPITPHMLRHSKAMHLLENGVNLIYIRDFLGHSSVTTTEVYARANPELKREALEKASAKIVKRSNYNPRKKKDLISWLKEEI